LLVELRPAAVLASRKYSGKLAVEDRARIEGIEAKFESALRRRNRGKAPNAEDVSVERWAMSVAINKVRRILRVTITTRQVRVCDDDGAPDRSTLTKRH
jgi:hypothetical protein